MNLNIECYIEMAIKIGKAVSLVKILYLLCVIVVEHLIIE